MGMIFAIILSFVAMFTVPWLITKITGSEMTVANWVVRGVCGALFLSMVLGTSFVTVGDNQIAQMKRIYMASDLPKGRIIGIGSQKGKKAETIGPGFHFVLGLNVLNDVEKQNMITVPPGFFATLSAKDGRPLPPGVTYAPSFQQNLIVYLDAEVFLTTTDDNVGFKGPQATVLLPGTWRVNTSQR